MKAINLSKKLTTAHMHQQGMLVNLPKRCYEMKRLHIYDAGGRNSISGINATVFGGSSVLGMVTGSMLTRMGSTCVYPYRNTSTIWDIKFKELKPTADLGYKSFVKLQDFTNQKELSHVIRDQNVVVNCVGSHVFTQKESDFEDANIRVPMAIAKNAAANPHVKRLIHISAAGADPNSQSMRLRTKWIGEQEVKEIFPDVTILRPTLMLNTVDPNPTIAAKWGMQMKMFNRMNFVIEGMNASVQPVFANDVALAILNSLKMEETIGQTYDLGGPHTYTYEDIYEQFFNLTEVNPYSVVVPLEQAYEYKQYPWFVSPYKKIFKQWLNPEFLTIESQTLHVNSENKGFKDLNIVPISFGHKAHELIQEITWMYNTHDVTKRDSANN